MQRKKIHPSTLILFSALIVVFFFAGRSISSVPAWPEDHMAAIIDSVNDDIRNVQFQFRDALNSGDSALFLKCYAPDACIMAPNAPILCGQRGLLQFFKGARKSGVRDGNFNPIGLYGQTSEYVTQQGAVELLDAAQHPLGNVKVLIVWKKTDEGWRIFRHMLNFDAPMPPAPASPAK